MKSLPRSIVTTVTVIPQMKRNNNCNGGWCASDDGEVRILPFGRGGNLILCRACYENEMHYRRERNTDTLHLRATPHPLPAWESLEIYKANQ